MELGDDLHSHVLFAPGGMGVPVQQARELIVAPEILHAEFGLPFRISSKNRVCNRARMLGSTHGLALDLAGNVPFLVGQEIVQLPLRLMSVSFSSRWSDS